MDSMDEIAAEIGKAPKTFVELKAWAEGKKLDLVEVLEEGMRAGRWRRVKREGQKAVFALAGARVENAKPELVPRPPRPDVLKPPRPPKPTPELGTDPVQHLPPRPAEIVTPAGEVRPVVLRRPPAAQVRLPRARRAAAETPARAPISAAAEKLASAVSATEDERRADRARRQRKRPQRSRKPSNRPRSRQRRPTRRRGFMPETLSTQEAAELLGVSPASVTAYWRDGKLKGKKSGDGPRAPILLEKGSVEKYKAERDGDGHVPRDRALVPRKKKATEMLSTEPALEVNGGASRLRVRFAKLELEVEGSSEFILSTLGGLVERFTGEEG